jgi:hypothetical protein
MCFANGRGRIGCDDLADDEPIERHAESRRSEKPIAAPQSVKTTESDEPRGYDLSKKAFRFSYRPAAPSEAVPRHCLAKCEIPPGDDDGNVRNRAVGKEER